MTLKNTNCSRNKAVSKIKMRSTTPKEKRIMADGGLPINKIFDQTDANRVSDLEWAQDDDNRLYAISRPAGFEQPTLVRVDAQEGTVERVDNAEADKLTLTEVPNQLTANKGD
jgi:hypothetical protein